MKKATLALALLGTLCQFSAYAAQPVQLAPRQQQLPCANNTPDFNQWIQGIYNEAKSQGISDTVFAAARPYMLSDPAILAQDRKQTVFNQTWLKFSDRMINRDRLMRGPVFMKKYAKELAGIEAQFGIPKEVLVAYAGLESDYGASKGKTNIITAVTTLAYDCRRPDFFRPQVLAALKIIQIGDQTPESMMGDWAGEFGPMQITPGDYVRNRVDYDRDGRADLINSVPDALASAANYLHSLGWKKGQPWIAEVRVPDDERWNWKDADIRVSKPVSEWVKEGVELLQGAPSDMNLQASLTLPMGRLGPAFLIFDNFKGPYLTWNQSMVYSLTAAFFSRRLSGDGPAYRGNGVVVPLEPAQILELQRLLVKREYSIGAGKPDGKMGTETRNAIREAQLRLRLPADAYPTAELLNQLQSGY
jgi:lytic murein transglycosylase